MSKQLMPAYSVQRLPKVKRILICRLRPIYLWWSLCLVIWPLSGWPMSSEGFESVHYQLDVTYDAATQRIHGQMSFGATWRENGPLTAIYFFLMPNTLSRRDPREPAAFHDLRYVKGFDTSHLTVRQVTNRAGNPLPFEQQDDPAVPVGHVPDRGLLRVALAQPYHAGERVHFTIAFETRLPRAKNWGVYRGVLALDGRWYPMLVPYRQGRWIWGMQEFVHARYMLRLTTDMDQQIVASVPWREQREQQGKQIRSGSANSLHHLGLSSRAGAQQTCDRTQPPWLCIWARPRDQRLVARLMPMLRRILVFYRQQFAFELPAELAMFTVVVHERDLEWPFSASADNLLFLSRDLIRVPGLLRKLTEFHLARGVAEQQWGLRQAYNLDTGRWIGEGLTTYMALRWLDHAYGPGRNFLTWKGAWLPNFSYREQSVGVLYRGLVVQKRDQLLTAPLSKSTDRQSLRFLHEKKSALMYSMLHDLLGAETFRHALQQLATESETSILSLPILQRTVVQASGKDLDWFFQQWVQQRVQLDYAVGEVDITPEADASQQTVYINQVEVRRLGEGVIPLTVRLLAIDGEQYETRLSGRDASTTVTWRHSSPLSDVQLDPDGRVPDVQRLNNTIHIPYSVRPLFDFPRQDRYLIYPFISLENNFIDGNFPRLSMVARYLNDQGAIATIGYKETLNEVSFEGQLWRRRFPHPAMTSSLSFSDRTAARTLAVNTHWTLAESHQQYRIPANGFTLGYQVSFLRHLDTFNGELVPDDGPPSDGRFHSVVFGYRRDVRLPTAVGAPFTVIPEPLSYGYALRLNVELSSKALGSSRADFQQVRWEASEFLRLWNQSWLQLRVFGGWSAGTVPLQRKLTLAGINAVRGYPYRLRLLGDRMLGGTLGLRLPLLRDVRVEEPLRLFALRSLHIQPFVDAGWVWDVGDDIDDSRLRSGAGLRLIAQMGFGGLIRFEVAVDIAHAIDARGRREDEGVQVWVRIQSTTRGGLH